MASIHLCPERERGREGERERERERERGREREREAVCRPLVCVMGIPLSTVSLNFVLTIPAME